MAELFYTITAILLGAWWGCEIGWWLAVRTMADCQVNNLSFWGWRKAVRKARARKAYRDAMQEEDEK